MAVKRSHMVAILVRLPCWPGGVLFLSETSYLNLLTARPINSDNDFCGEPGGILFSKDESSPGLSRLSLMLLKKGIR